MSNVVEIGTGRRDFESSLKKFLKMTSDLVSEDTRRRYFIPTPTRNARRVRGKILEKRRQAREEAEG